MRKPGIICLLLCLLAMTGNAGWEKNGSSHYSYAPSGKIGGEKSGTLISYELAISPPVGRFIAPSTFNGCQKVTDSATSVKAKKVFDSTQSAAFDFSFSMRGRLALDGDGEGTLTWSASAELEEPFFIQQTANVCNGDTETVTFSSFKGGEKVTSRWTASPEWDGYQAFSGKVLKIGKDGDWKPTENNKYYITATMSNSSTSASGELTYAQGKEYDSIDIGPFHLAFSPAIKGTPKADGSYEFSGAGQLTGSITGKFAKSLDLSNVPVSFAVRDDKVISASILWQNTEGTPCGELAIFDVVLKEIACTVSNESMVAHVTFSTELTEDVELEDHYKPVLKSGAKGTFTYAFDTRTTGTWTFDITGMKVVLALAGKTAAEGTISSINQDGECKNIDLKLKNSGPYEIHGYKFNLNNLETNFDFNLISRKGKLNKGDAKLTIDAPKNIGGKLIVEAVFKAESIVASLEGKKLSAFGGILAGEIAVKFVNFLELDEISGSNISFTHGQITKKDGTALTGCSFSIKEGGLKELKIEKAAIKYSNFNFNMSDATFSNDTLNLSAACSVGSDISMAVDNFKIDSTGNVSLEKMNAHIAKAPLTIDGAFKQTSSGISGKMAVDISGAGFDAEFALGATSDFNYASAKLSMSSASGILLGNSGVYLLSVGGVGAYNHTVKQTEKTFSLGAPAMDNHALGVNATIRDVGKLAKLSGTTLLRLGNNAAFSVSGALAMPATGAQYLNGTANVEYMFGDGMLRGKVDSTLKIPAGTGSVFLVDNSKLNFSLRPNGNVSVSAQAHASLLSKVDMNIDTLIYQYTENTYSGISRGSASFSSDGVFCYPENFGRGNNSANTNWAGFGIFWDYELEASGGYNINLLPENYSGEVYAQIDSQFDVYAKWDGFLGIGKTIIDCNARISGQLDVVAANSAAQVQGELTAAYNNETGSFHFECEL